MQLVRVTIFIAFLFFLGSSEKALAQLPELSSNARFSVITCSPGPDLYSIFGHTAIRFQDVLNGKQVDWVYNYGTFEFSDDFYWKFSLGKLDYVLSKSHFGEFQYEYIVTGRGVYEQELNFTPEEKTEFFRLLEENYLPENRTYRYDFFLDNCATRVRDMIVKASSQAIFFENNSGPSHTFRDAIQNYLDYMPWSDFGIDLALGLPCDRVMRNGQVMFLPDSLMKEFVTARKGSELLTKPTEELLPVEFELFNSDVLTPINLFFFFLIIQLITGFIFLRKGKYITPFDRVLLFITGVIGVMVVFLWFFTDHTATKGNLNLLWANPIQLILVFLSQNRKWILFYWKMQLALLALTIVGWFFLPQKMHLASFALAIGLFFVALRQVRPNLFQKLALSK